jgi:hypothetical protein
LGFVFLEITACLRAVLVFGFFLPWALAPIISLTGDFFELGSLFLYQIWPGPDGTHRNLISDDVFRLMKEMGSGSMGIRFSFSSAFFVATSFVIGAGLAWGTILLSNTLRILSVNRISRLCLNGSESDRRG